MAKSANETTLSNTTTGNWIELAPISWNMSCRSSSGVSCLGLKLDSDELMPESFGLVGEGGEMSVVLFLFIELIISLNMDLSSKFA